VSLLIQCRRDTGVKIAYRLISEASFANRHMVTISWSKSQEIISPDLSHIDCTIFPQQFVFKMTDVATHDSKQSEAYIATTALFAIFGSTKEEKVFMRLPTVWKDLWTEFAEAKKNQIDAQDRAAINELRGMVRQRLDQEEEDGVILQSAFKGRGAGRNQNDTNDLVSSERANGQALSPEYYQRIWAEKASTPRFYTMLVSINELFHRLSSSETNTTRVSNLACSFPCGISDIMFWTPLNRTRSSLCAVKRDGR
jgi:ATP-dependent RNA helicase DHX29